MRGNSDWNILGPQMFKSNLHRVLIDVEEVEKDIIFVRIPSWRLEHIVAVPRYKFPSHWKIKEGDYLLGYANINAEFSEDLNICNFEENLGPVGP